MLADTDWEDYQLQITYQSNSKLYHILCNHASQEEVYEYISKNVGYASVVAVIPLTEETFDVLDKYALRKGYVVLEGEG